MERHWDESRGKRGGGREALKGHMKKRPDGNSVDLIIMKEPRVLFDGNIGKLKFGLLTDLGTSCGRRFCGLEPEPEQSKLGFEFSDLGLVEQIMNKVVVVH